MAAPVIVYYDIDPSELNPHIFRATGERPVYSQQSSGPYLVREMMEKYLQGSIEAGKPAYLNAIVLAADEYTNDEGKTVPCAICRIPGWDSVPPPYDTQNCIPAFAGLIYGDNAESNWSTFKYVDFNLIFQHSVYFAATDTDISLSALLPKVGDNLINAQPDAGSIVNVSIVKVTFADFKDYSRAEIIGVSKETFSAVAKVDPTAMASYVAPSSGSPATTGAPPGSPTSRTVSTTTTCSEAGTTASDPQINSASPFQLCSRGDFFPLPPAGQAPDPAGSFVGPADDPWIFPSQLSSRNPRVGKAYIKDNINPDGTKPWKYLHVAERKALADSNNNGRDIVKFLAIHWPVVGAVGSRRGIDNWAPSPDSKSGGRVATYQTFLRSESSTSVHFDVGWDGSAFQYISDPWRARAIHGDSSTGPLAGLPGKNGVPWVNNVSIGIEVLNPIFTKSRSGRNRTSEPWKSATPAQPESKYSDWDGLVVIPKAGSFFNYSQRPIQFQPKEQLEAAWSLCHTLMMDSEWQDQHLDEKGRATFRVAGGPFPKAGGSTTKLEFEYIVGYTGMPHMISFENPWPDTRTRVKGHQIGGHFRWSTVKQDDYFTEYYIALRLGRFDHNTGSRLPGHAPDAAYELTRQLFWRLTHEPANGPRYPEWKASYLKTLKTNWGTPQGTGPGPSTAVNSSGWPKLFRVDWAKPGDPLPTLP